jgi:transcriptional regulator with GAF, ATPase, and Fis domain
MTAYFDLFRSLSEELEPRRLQRKFLSALLEMQDVSRGSIWIRKGDGYKCVEALGEQSGSIQGLYIGPGDPSIVGWVIENRQMTVAEPSADGRHHGAVEDGLNVKSSKILCFPLFLRDGTVYGAVQIIDTSPDKSRLNLDSGYLDNIQKLIDVGSIALSNAVVYRQKHEETESLKHTLEQIQGESRLIGQGPAFQQARELMESYALTEYPVLITGESGTGKELFARRIHQLSHRRDEPFLVQNCSAIPETLLESELFGYTKGAFTGAVKNRDGLFEAAHGGTLFLDEIGDMPLNLQARILRVIQDGEVKPLGANRARQVDVRIVSATHRNLTKMVSEDRFREDLFYRLSVLPLPLPALRERLEDIPLLLKHFMNHEAAKMLMPPKRLSREAVDLLTTYGWGGNIRELENFVRYILVTSEKELIEGKDLPPPMTDVGQRRRRTDRRRPPDRSFSEEEPGHFQPVPFDRRSWEEVERDYVLYLMKTSNWNITRAAKTAKVNRSTFVSRMRRLGVVRKR